MIGAIVGGRYKVDGVLGKGGFGTVFAAKHVTTKQDVVVKVLNAQVASDRTQVQRFFNEARMTSQLTHPNTVRVFDFGHTDTGALFIVMERLNGEEMAVLLKQEQQFAPMRVMRIACAVLRSLSEAHEIGLVHRDLKPSNIFLCEVHGEKDFVKLLDFGIAKDTEADGEADLTKTGFALGTPKYMSPEQGKADKLDRRSDLYSLGVIMYEALAGQAPFSARSGMQLIVKHLQEPPPPLQNKVEGLPDGLAPIVMTALQKHPGSRFYDADDMRAAIEMVMERAGEPVQSNKRAQTAAVRGLTPADVMSAAAVDVGAEDETAATQTPSHAHVGQQAAAPVVAATVMTPAASTTGAVHEAATTAIPTPVATKAVAAPPATMALNVTGQTETVAAPDGGGSNPWKAAVIGGGLAIVLVVPLVIFLMRGGGDEPAASAAAKPAVVEPAAAREPEKPEKSADPQPVAAPEAEAQPPAAKPAPETAKPDPIPAKAEPEPAKAAPTPPPPPAPQPAPPPPPPAKPKPKPVAKKPAPKPRKKTAPKKSKPKVEKIDGDMPL